jgi:FKBP-type peptidyl-prolyl cis-trans isomerase FklB
MKVGSKWEIFVPAELAYGERGAGTKVGPNSTLIFEIELLGIQS